MATIEQLSEALRRADEAGDVQAATKLAGAIKAMRATAPPTNEGGILRTADDFMRGVADTSSFGFSDEISAGMGALTGVGGEKDQYEQNLAAERARDEKGGWTRFGGQVAGAFLNPAGAARTMIGAAAKGAGYGGLYGFGSGEGDVYDRLPSTGMGLATGGVAGSAVHGIGNALANRAANKATPSIEELRAAKDQAYQAVDDMGHTYAPEQLQHLGQGVRDTLAADGLDAVFHPRANRAMQIIEEKVNQPQSLTDIDRLRQFVRENVVDENPMLRTQGRMGGHIIDEIDDFVDAADGPSSEAILKARALNSKLRKSELVADALTRAERRAGSTGSGGNVDNASRQNLRGILDNPKKSRGFTDEERALMETIVRGEGGQNLARQIGKLSPGGNGLQQALALGATAYNPLMAVAPATGLVAKALADRRTAGNIEKLQQMIRGGSESQKKVAEALMKIRKTEGVAIPALAKLGAALAPVPFY